MEYYPVLKGKGILTHATTWVNLGDILLSEMSQSQKDKYHPILIYEIELSWWLSGKESACNAGDVAGATGLIPGLGRSPWRRKWQPTPVFLPEESHGQRSLAGYSPQGSQRAGHD